MNKKDFLLVTIIGGAVGLLVQLPITTISEVTPSFLIRFVVFVALLLLAPLALFVAHVVSRWWAAIYQFAKFAAVGVLNTLIDAGILNALIVLTGIASGVNYSLFKAISFVGATTNSFLWNKLWTFGAKDKTTVGETAKFYSVAIFNWILNVAVASFVVNVLPRPGAVSENLWANIGLLAGVAASFIGNFVGYKFFVFKKPDLVIPKTE